MSEDKLSGAKEWLRKMEVWRKEAEANQREESAFRRAFSNLPEVAEARANDRELMLDARNIYLGAAVLGLGYKA